MADKEKARCAECGSRNAVKKGKRKSKYGAVQKYFCNDCSRYFTLKKLEKKMYPAKVIMQAISYYNLGNSLDESSKLINGKFKIKISPRIIDMAGFGQRETGMGGFVGGLL